jgi:hypothetical protein
MGKLKHKPSQQIKITKPDEIESEHPVFSFKHLQTKPKNPKDKIDFYAEFTERLHKISSLTWDEIIYNAHRHSFGTEKIPIKKIKPQLPLFITPDITHLIAFRATGDNRPFLGIRKGNVFYIIFIEESFGNVYNHN